MLSNAKRCHAFKASKESFLGFDAVCVHKMFKFKTFA